LRAELDRENRERAEPAMRAAARGRGAELLSLQPALVGFGTICESSVLPELRGQADERNCQREEFLDGQGYRFVDASGVVKIALFADRGRSVMDEGAWPYTRLARRGNRLVRLRPKPTFVKLGSRTQCRCSGGPHTPDSSLPVFVLDDGPYTAVEDVDVPVTVDSLDWHCEFIAV